MINKTYNIIYLEDDNFYPEIIEMLLNDTEFKIVSKFQSKDEILNNLTKVNFDIAILDLMIDNFELIDFLDFIKTVNSNAKLMILTTLLDGEVLYKYKNIGIENIVSKKELKLEFLVCLTKLSKNISYYSPKILYEINKYEKSNVRLVKINNMLTKREKQILELLHQKKNTNDIMEILNISQNTVFSYYKEIKEKINLLIIEKDEDFAKFKKINKIEEIYKIL